MPKGIYTNGYYLEKNPAWHREIKPKSLYKIYHIPLDLSVQTALRSGPIIKARVSTGHIHYFTKEIAIQI